MPSDWRVAHNYTDANAYGWFRRHIDATSEQVVAASLLLALGAVSKRDITYLVAGPRLAPHTDLLASRHTHILGPRKLASHLSPASASHPHTHIPLASRTSRAHTHA